MARAKSNGANGRLACNQAEFSRRWNVSRARISQLVAAGKLPRVAGGVDLAASDIYMAHRPGLGRPGNPERRAALDRKLAAQAALLEMEYDRRASLLCTVAGIGQVAANAGRLLKNCLAARNPRLAKALTDKSAQDVRLILADADRRMLMVYCDALANLPKWRWHTLKGYLRSRKRDSIAASRGWLYILAKLLGDVQAVKKGRTGQAYRTPSCRQGHWAGAQEAIQVTGLRSAETFQVFFGRRNNFLCLAIGLVRAIADTLGGERAVSVVQLG